MTTSCLRWGRSQGAHAALLQLILTKGQDSDVQALGDHETEVFRILRGRNKAKNWIPALDCTRAMDWSWSPHKANFIHSRRQLRGKLERVPWQMVLKRKEVQSIWLIFKHILLQPQAKSNLASNRSSQGGRRPVQISWPWLNSDIKRWKQGQMTWKGYGNTL